MGNQSIVSIIKGKAYKLKEIALFHLLKLVDWQKAPELDQAFVTGFNSDAGVIKKFLMQDIDKEKVVCDADRICSGELKLYSIDPKTFKNDLSWHKDYYSGYQWTLMPFNRIYDPNDSGFDLNIPFELSRLQFIPTLIQAFEITSAPKYKNRLIELIDNWIDNNPYCFGVNWWSPMEVGLRAVNLALAISFLANNLGGKKLKCYLNILWKHALYIYKYDVVADRVKNKNNHFLGSMLGLLAVSMCFNGAKAAKFRDFAISEFRKEIPRQFMEDGGNFESATGYHQFSLEVILVVILFLRQYHNNSSKDFVCEIFGKDIFERLNKALNMVWSYMNCYGQSPHIGDSSDCRVLVFKDYFKRKSFDHSFLFKLGSSTTGYKIPSEKDRIVSIFPDSGYACFKNRLYGIIAFAGPKGTNSSGGHGHNDKGSFVMRAEGQQIFVDSGTYIYNPAIYERLELKKSSAHNIVVVDEKEQCEVTSERVFGLIGVINSKRTVSKEGNKISIQMEHDGYSRFDELGIISREIVCDDSTVRVNDTINGSGLHKVSVYYHLHPAVSCNIKESSAYLTVNKIKMIRITFPDNVILKLNECNYSDRYHHKDKKFSLVASASLSLPTSLRTVVEIL